MWHKFVIPLLDVIYVAARHGRAGVILNES